jgi:hypothetical protein
MNISIDFVTGGNKSACLGYDIGGGQVQVVSIEDDFGDVTTGDSVFTVPTCGTFNVFLAGYSNPSGGGSQCTTPAPVIQSTTAVPVTYGNIEVKSERNVVILNWNTLSEINNDRFEIERSLDGKKFNLIGEVRGNGTSNLLNSYSFVDDSAFTGVNYYRLKQIDHDGQYEYSKVVTINFSGKINFSMISNFISEEILLTANNETTISIFNYTGKFIRSQRIMNGSVSIDFTDQPSGIYFILDSESRNVFKFIKK